MHVDIMYANEYIEGHRPPEWARRGGYRDRERGSREERLDARDEAAFGAPNQGGGEQVLQLRCFAGPTLA